MTAKLIGTGPLLVVDDDPVDIAILERCFRKSALAETHEMIALRSGRELLDYMTEVESATVPMPSIILLDINMPGMNGFEALKTLRSQPPFASIPTIMFVSNSDNPEDVSRANELGADFAEKFDEPALGVKFFDHLI